MENCKKLLQLSSLKLELTLRLMKFQEIFIPTPKFELKV